MRHILTILAALFLCASAQAQTVKALSYNSTNDTVVQTQRITFQQIGVAAGTAASPSTTYAIGTNNIGIFASTQLGIGPHLGFSVDGTRRFLIATNTIRAELPISFGTTTNAAASRTNLGLAQFKDAIGDNWAELYDNGELRLVAGNTIVFYESFDFGGTNAESYKSSSRTNLGLGATWLTNTNVTNFRSAIGLGATNDVLFDRLIAGATNQPAQLTGDIIAQNGSGEELHINSGGFTFYQGTNAGGSLLAEERSLGGGNWSVESSLTIRQSTSTNGLLYIYRTNNESFLGLANLIASNNTTISNETLFRVGVAEATNKAAQFGFRSTNTNGNGVAVFSVFGYNALMMIGPSDRSRTNTATNAGIEADIWTITPTNRVMTLRDTNTGALTMHQDLGFGAGLTNTTPTNTNTPAVWLRVWVGTNSYRVPLYQ
jgi:hypothetical protein